MLQMCIFNYKDCGVLGLNGQSGMTLISSIPFIFSTLIRHDIHRLLYVILMFFSNLCHRIFFSLRLALSLLTSVLAKC